MVYIRNTSHVGFVKMLEKTSKDIVLICAGERAKKLYDEYFINSNVVFALDNYKCGQELDLGEKHINVYSFGCVSEELENKILVLTTIRYIREIIDQLDEILLFNDLEIYVPELFTVDDEPWNFKPGYEWIPKTIHYCWFGGNELPKQFVKNIDTWKRNCPEFEIVRWDENNYDVSKNEYMRQAYENKKLGFVPDFARLDIIYNYGGIYLDTDVEVLENYRPLLTYEMFCGYENSNFVNFGLGFGAKKGHRILKYMMETYEKMEFVNKDGSLNLVASPVLQTQAFKDLGFCLDGYTKEQSDVLFLASMYLAPLTSAGIGRANKHTFSIHQYEASWFSKENKIWKTKHLEFGEYINSHMKYN